VTGKTLMRSSPTTVPDLNSELHWVDQAFPSEPRDPTGSRERPVRSSAHRTRVRSWVVTSAALGRRR
jgi:hypothetical protein